VTQIFPGNQEMKHNFDRSADRLAVFDPIRRQHFSAGQIFNDGLVDFDRRDGAAITAPLSAAAGAIVIRHDSPLAAELRACGRAGGGVGHLSRTPSSLTLRILRLFPRPIPYPPRRWLG